MIYQVHGIMIFDTKGALQRLQLIDRDEHITIFHTGMDSLKLDSEQCRYFARVLVDAAKRLDERAKK